ncbi:DNA damage checkpoint control protein MEC3 [Lachancea thermotolerans]
MKLKIIVNGSQSPEDFKLLKSTVATVASLRKTAVLRFTSERLVIVSSSSSTASGSSVLHGDKGQLWCTIPRDAFTFYSVVSARDLNTIAMECSCDMLHSILKKYDKTINQGNEGDMIIKLQSMPEWNANTSQASDGKNGSAARINPMCALGVTFEEVVYTSTDANASVKSGGGNSGGIKTISHSFKVPARLLFRAQDAKIQEPMINYTQLMMYRLPAPQGEWGRGFQNFLRRVERYSNVNNIKLSAKKFWQQEERTASQETACDHAFKIVVNELDWYLEICWNGPLDAMVQPENIQEDVQDSRAPAGADPTHAADQSLFIEDSASNTNDPLDLPIENTPEAPQDVQPSKHEVIIRCKDWKVCSKLYDVFEEVVLAISHDESCVFHCTLPRGNVEDENGERAREYGQVIYYMARAKKI